VDLGHGLVLTLVGTGLTQDELVHVAEQVSVVDVDPSWLGAR
jgi:hypothetical protein